MNLEVQIPGGVGGSSRAGSAISGRSATRLADRWEYVTTPPPKAWTEHVLESKLRPRESGLAPPRVKRESSEDPLMSGAILKNRRTSTVCTQVNMHHTNRRTTLMPNLETAIT